MTDLDVLRKIVALLRSDEEFRILDTDADALERLIGQVARLEQLVIEYRRAYERALAHKNILAERLGAAHAEIQALYRVVTAARAWRANGPCDECLEDLDAALAALGGNQ